MISFNDKHRSALSLIKAGLRDEALGSRSCPLVLIGCISTIYDDGNHGEHPEQTMKDTVSSVCKLAVRWVTKPRSLEERERLQVAECPCSETLWNDEWHAIGKEEVGKGGGPVLLNVVMLCLNPFTQFMSIGRTRYDRKPHFLAKRPIWPKDVKSILPHDARGTILGVLQWATTIWGIEWEGMIANALQAIIKACTPLVMPYLARTCLFLDRIFYIFVRDHSYLFTQGMVEIGLVALNLHHIVKTVHMASSSCTITELPLFWSHNPKESMEVCLLGMKVAGELKRSSHRYRAHDFDLPSSLESMLGDMMSQLHKAVHRSPSMSIVAWNCLSGQQQWDIFEDLMRSLSYMHRCANAGCVRSTDDARRRFQQCLGCWMTLYCSRRCQKRAWGNSQAPHRHVCKHLGSIVLDIKRVLSHGLGLPVSRELNLINLPAIVGHVHRLEEARTTSCRELATVT
jgi:hypothetical protein